jgi:hypothetical protein
MRSASGGIICDQDTYDACDKSEGSRFEFEPLGKLTLKGLHRPVAAFAVTRNQKEVQPGNLSVSSVRCCYGDFPVGIAVCGCVCGCGCG